MTTVIEAVDAAALVARLGWASLAGGLFVAAVWVVSRALPRLPAGVRCALWWSAGAKLLIALLWTAPFELPVEVPAGLAPTPAHRAVAVEAVPPPAAEAAPGATGRPRLPVAQAAPNPFPWRGLLAALWAAGAALGGARLARELAAARRLRNRSRPADLELVARFHDLRRRLGVQRPVELRLSDAAPGPLTLGLLHPAVVLPARDLHRLSREEVEMALGHELLHVRRRDLWAGWVPQLARCLFFFHPLATLAAREYLLGREAACDAGVLRELGAPPRSYGRLLLLWSRRAPDPAPAGSAVAGASPTFLELKRRLVMLQNYSSPSWRLKAAGGALAALALAALLPVRIVAQTPELPEMPELPELAEPGEPPELPELPELAEMPELPDPAPREPRTSGSTWSYTGDGQAWALLEPGGDAWMHGSSRDLRRIKALQSDAGSALLWFRRDGLEYVVRDRAVLDQAREILEPQRDLGRQQGELGARQGDLGAEQGALGAQQGELGAQQGELGARQALLGAEMASLAAELAHLHARRMTSGEDESEGLEAQEARIEERMERLEDQMEELGRQQETLAERQEALGRDQKALGERQEALGGRQEELGRRQEAAARRAEARLQELFDRAVARGEAEPVK